MTNALCPKRCRKSITAGQRGCSPNVMLPSLEKVTARIDRDMTCNMDECLQDMISLPEA